MKNSNQVEIKRGQAISFRVPSDTPDHLLKHLQRLKETERRNFSSKIAEFVMQGVVSSNVKERETITIPLPHKLSKSQRDWLKHEHSEALIGNIVYQLLTDPVRSTALLASFNSNSLDIDRVLYLQEDLDITVPKEPFEDDNQLNSTEEVASTNDLEIIDDDLSDFNWEEIRQEQPETEKEDEETEDNLQDLLGDFLDKMNK
ncbi:hypothetical protein [Bacillus sp. FJAT-45350]|uniref:hypothetical protein n=1 Tax=Bacillus sp. FJAT-45350 TaxID=2011014 RepID=UPI000BB6ECD0|nr:hypothetical protein [Bacillus sp. FJAT-45350]